MVVVRDRIVGTAETTLGKPGHAAHNSLFWGHFSGIWAANGHATGTFGPETRGSEGGAEAANQTQVVAGSTA